jgi:hypothetical protein
LLDGLIFVRPINDWRFEIDLDMDAMSQVAPRVEAPELRCVKVIRFASSSTPILTSQL